VPHASIPYLVSRINFARQYTLGLIADIDDNQWFHSPSDGVTNVAWQMGHLAVAQFGLAIGRLRDVREDDRQLLPEQFRALYGKGSQPSDDPSGQPTPQEIRRVAAAVHEQVLKELPAYAEEELDAALPNPHPVFRTKRGAVEFCAAHELIHAGQIALVRRMLGKAPLR